MKTIQLTRPHKLELLEQKDASRPSSNEVLVRTRRVGICGTDLHAYQGNFPFMDYPRILGHELSVEIVHVGKDAIGARSLKVGDLCAVEPYLNCGQCVPCILGKYNCCTSLNVIGVHSNGGMCEQFTISPDKLHPAVGIDLEKLAVVEMLSIGAHAIRRARPLNGKKVAVLGLGPIGLSVANFAIIAGADLLLADVNEVRLAFANQEFGLKGILASSRIKEEMEDQFGLPEIVFDATGNLDSMNSSFELVQHGGEIVFVGLVADKITFDDPHFHSHELTLKASRNATASDFGFVIETLKDGRTDITNWISHVVSPEVLVRDIPLWTNPNHGVIKGVVDFDN